MVLVLVLLLIIKQYHQSQYYADVAFCYRWSSMVCRSVMIVSPPKMDEPIEMPFGTWTCVGIGKHVLDGSAHWRHLW